MKETRDFLNTLLKDKDICILACSGGPDSIFLLHLLLEIKKKKNIQIICAHVNHNTRPNNKKEEEFIKDYLASLNVPCEFYKIENYRKGKFTEEEGREKRYEFLKQVVKKYHATYLFTAHHADDLVETIFMRILRGSTLKGYAGINRRSTWDDVQIIRPLLNMTKKEILDELKSKNIPYVIDETNESENYIRNRIRKNIIPYLSNEEPNYAKKFLKFSSTLLEAEQFIEEKTKDIPIENNKIIKEKFLECSKTEQKRILKKYLKENYDKDLKKITDRHLMVAFQMIESNKEKDKIDFPKNKTLKKNKKYIWLQDKKGTEKYKIEVNESIVLPDGSMLKKEEDYTIKSNYEIHLNSKEIKLPLYITTRTSGMKMEVKNLNGSKKVKDILIDAHIDQDEKDAIPILIDANSTVLWVCGIKKSKYDLEKEQNYDIIYKYIKKEGKNYEKNQ